MDITPQHYQQIARTLWRVVVLVIASAVSFTGYTIAEKRVDRTNEQKVAALSLTMDVQSTINKLSRLARNYILTHDEDSKKQYQELVNQSNLKTTDYRLLNDAIYQSLTSDEIALLNEALQRTTLLKQIELKVISAKEAKPSPDSSYDLEQQKLTALTALDSGEYQLEKLAILAMLDQLRQQVDYRTDSQLNQAKNIATTIGFLFVFLSLLLLASLWQLYRGINRLLGAPITQVHQQIMQLATAELTTKIHLRPGTENSVMAWIKAAQEKLGQLLAVNNRLKQLYAALSQCNQAIVRTKTETELFPIICRDVVNFGGMKMAWIGVHNPETKTLDALSYYGNGTDYLDGLRISTNPEDPLAHGPTGTAFLTDQPYWCQDFQNDPATTPWHERAKRFDWRSSAAIPLHKNGEVIGIFSLYSDEINAFDEPAQLLLLEMAMDISFALDNFEREAKRLAAEKALSESSNLMRSIINTAPVRIFWKDSNLNYLGCNTLFARDAGAENPTSLIGKSDFDMPWKVQAKRHRADDLTVMRTNQAVYGLEQPQNTPDGKIIWLSISKAPLHNQFNEIVGIVGVYDDITERKRIEQKIRHMAHYDELTGLANRAYLTEQIKQHLITAKQTQTSLAMLSLDIDHFKDINDSLGHSIGDMLLVQIAQRIAPHIQSDQIFARLDGDNFILLVPNTTKQEAEARSKALIEIIKQPYRINEHELIVSGSIGIALYPEDGESFETLYKNADAAMYHAKHLGRSTYSFFTTEMQALSLRKLALSNALHNAIKLNELSLHYQPQISLSTGKITGAEALLRWQHPTFGAISPAEFIPIAEANGAIIPIGEWVIRTAMQQTKTWLDQGLPPFTIAVNLSAVQFKRVNLTQLIHALLAETALPAHYLEVELTESIAMTDPDKAITTMRTLSELGVRISIDDFGTGYSSLNYLKKFTIDKLKVDQSFVRDISVDAEDRAIVTTIINMAKNLGLHTIAEGVETQAQAEFLAAQGCDEVQGYYYSKPLDSEAFVQFIQKNT
ncbi:MAG: EAL domain-containing protein [Thiotrichales bacterium]|jgi:diguanylate cyclase (GGDEF)-like protein/PAS domain S-box-containing protein|nr:EAL domain-containing protein [Thiotrichales bacterium]